MTQYISEPVFEHVEFNTGRPGRDPERAISGDCYAHDLRVIGQLAEGYSFASLQVDADEDHYQVCGRGSGYKAKVIPFTRLLGQWFAEPGREGRETEGKITFKATASKIIASDKVNHKRRQNAADVADAYSLSQTLRAVGFYLDTRENARLKKVTVREDCVCVEYQNCTGETEKVEQKKSFFYDYWVQMYLRRHERSKAPSYAWTGAEPA